MRVKTYITVFICLIICHVNCTKGDLEGPSINDLYGNFNITDPLQINNHNPDFSSGDMVSFYCGFNKSINWTINIKGLQSNSSKELSGFSSSLDSNSTIWNGNSSQFPFFIEENCAVEITFLNEPDTLRDTINILGAKTYDEGIVIADFENGLPPEAIVYINPNNFANDTFNLASDSPLLGDSYYMVRGRVNWEWNIGKIDFKLDLNSTVPAENFYINIGILSDTVNLHTGQFFNILISESDLPFNDDLSNNGADIFESSMEVYKLKVPVDWNGWQILSFRYSDFEELSSNATGVVFNKNPSNITGIRIAFQACPSSGADVNCPENFDKPVRIDLDHIVLTENNSLLGQ
jgi:hypothetical protein